MDNRPTVSLQMIVKDEVKDLERIIRAAQDWFDVINITISDKKTFDDFAGRASAGPAIVQFDYREWPDDFADQRNHNLSLCKTDYYFWIDADDEFDFSHIPSLIRRAEEEEVDAIYLPYDYAHDANGVCIARHSRERLLKNNKVFSWKGAIHETMIPEDRPKILVLDEPAVVHRATEEDIDNSMERNHEYLVRLGTPEDADPRYVYYLGLSYFGMAHKKQDPESFVKSIETLKRYIPRSGWDEEIYLAMCKISEAYNYLGNELKATEYALQALGSSPERLDAYYLLAQYEHERGNFEQCIEWLKMVFQKEKPKTLSVHDPTAPSRAVMVGAMSEYELGNFDKAHQLIKKAIEMNPSLSEAANLESIMAVEAQKERWINKIPSVLGMVGDEKKFFESLREELQSDIRLGWLKQRFTPPRIWKDNTIVFFCGKSYEEWGPHTLDKGMGGSEEAVIYLSRALTRLGYQVVVYGEVSEEVYDPVVIDDDTVSAVAYFPWQDFDKRDTFATCIIWRAPEFAPHIKAKVKIIDLHDIIQKDRVKNYEDATYFVKSHFHRNKYPALPDEKFNVIPNGVEVSQFIEQKKKKPFSVGYFSAYYRGLEMLLDMWPKIRERVPEATLDVYYGWESWIGLEGKDAFYHRMEAKFTELKDQGVTVHGRVSHEELAEAMKSIQVWAYPTEFEEIHCITAVKAQLAGCWPVVTAVGALPEVVEFGEVVDSRSIVSDEYKQNKFIDAVVASLTLGVCPPPLTYNPSWDNIAKQWEEFIDGKSK